MEDTNITPATADTSAPTADQAPETVPTPARISTATNQPQLLAAAMKAAADAASSDEARAVLTGVLFTADREAGTVTMQGCDSYRLQTVTMSTLTPQWAEIFSTPALLPRSFVLAAAKLLAPRKLSCAVVSVVDSGIDAGRIGGGRTFTVEAGGASVSAVELAGEYPNTANLRFDPAAGVPAVAAFDPVKISALHKSVSYFDDRSSSTPVIYRGHKPAPTVSAAGDRPAHNPAMMPAIWTASGDGWTFEALLMPIRLP